MKTQIFISIFAIYQICPTMAVFENPDDVKLVASGQNSFTTDLYLKFANKSEGNLFFSPFSIATCFGMLHMASNATTEAEFQTVFHYPEDKLSIRRGYKDLMTEFSSQSLGFTLKSSNKIYVRNGLNILDSFSNAITNDFLGVSENMDFGNPEARETINSYVEDETNSKIKDLLPQGSINANTRMVLVNAIYFKGSWKHQFKENKTKTAQFWVSNDESKDVQMMYQENKFHYGYNEELNAKILKLKYEGNASFVIVLPYKRDGLSELESKLGEVNLATLDNGLGKTNVHVQIPKFKLDVKSSNLKESLVELGLLSAFSGAADFSGLTGSKGLSINSVHHKAFLEVNEEGSEAAAATAIVVGYSMPPSFTADHPFLFFIKHDVSNAILFAGRFINP